jgi:soluble lytic murein transglycosylase-like protein
MPVTPRTPVRLDSAALERAVTKRFAYQPLSVALAKRTRKSELADRVAAALVYEAERNRLSPSLLAAVLLIENAPFDTTAISSQGAVGLMQVMPFHQGSYGCPSVDLHSVEANICHGARLLTNLVRRSNSLPLALKRYNGCVRGRNTPRCHRYPGRVLRTASRLRHEVLVTAAGFTEDQPDLMAMGMPGRPEVVPSEPMVPPDTAVAPSSSAAECTSFLGCLRYRWSSR